MTEKPTPLIAPRSNEDDGERRFREALERHGDSMMQTLDAAVALRQAHPATQRARHLSRSALQDAMLRMLNTYWMHRAQGPAEHKTSRGASR
jgi:hypothetical protein